MIGRQHSMGVTVSFRCVAPWIIGFLMLVSSAISAQEKGSNFDPFADALLEAASDYLASASEFSVHAEITFEEFLKSQQKVQLSRTVEIMVRRPDRLRAEILDDKGRRRLFFDGKTVSLHNLGENVYATVEQPGTIEQMVDSLRERYGMAAPLADLVVSNPYANYRENANSASYLGLHVLQGVKHHHILLANENVDYQVWIEDGAVPILRKILITYANQPGAPQFAATLTGWNFAPRLPDLAFTFTPPVDADEIEILPVKESAK